MIRGISLLILTIATVVAYAGPFEDVSEKHQSGRYDEAITLADDYIKANASNTDLAGSLTYLKAMSLLGKNNAQAFVQIANDFDSKYPNNKYASDMMSNLVGALYKQNNYAAVVESSMRYIEKYQKVHDVKRYAVDYHLVSSLTWLKKYDQIEPVVAKALAESPDHPRRTDLLLMDARASVSLRDCAKAYEKFQKLELGPLEERLRTPLKFYMADCVFKLAEDNRRKGEKPEVLNAQYKRALDLFDEFGKIGYHDKFMIINMKLETAQCYRRLKKYDVFDDAIKSALVDPLLQQTKGVLLYEQAESYYDRQLWTKALECYDAMYGYANLNASNSSFLKGRSGLADYHRVLCLMNMDNDQAFEAAAKEYLQKYPGAENSLDIEYNLSMVSYNKSDWPAAQKSLTAFLSTHPQASENIKNKAQDSLINSMIAAGQCDQARQSVQKFLAGNPSSSGQLGLKFLVSMADFKQQKWTEASAGLKKLIEISPEGEVAANARLYIGIAMMNEANKLKKSENAKAQVADLEQNGRKYLTDWMKTEKAVLQNEMDTMYYQDDFNGIKEIAGKYLQSGDQSDSAKKAQMLNWMGLVSINQTPADLKSAHDYFSQTLQVCAKNQDLLASEGAKAIFWNTWITLYNNDQQRVSENISKLKALPQGGAKVAYLRKLMYL